MNAIQRLTANEMNVFSLSAMHIHRYFRSKLIMETSPIDIDDLFLTTNQDYGSFYFGRCQHGSTDPNDIAFELAINDQVRNERRQLPSIAYNIMFDVCLLHVFSFDCMICFSYLEAQFT